MKPNAKQLIESITWSLDVRVAPVVEDKWAASTLRSVHCLLEHLAARVDSEGQLLHDDNLDLQEMTATLAGVLAAATGKVAKQRDGLAATSRAWRDASDYPTIASLTEENDTRRAALDELLRVLQVDSGDVGADIRAEALGLADAYLRRRLARDQPLFAPAFMSSTF